MKPAQIITAHRNVSWKISASLLAPALFVLWATPTQAAGCACSSKGAKTGIRAGASGSCCGGSPGQKSGNVSCACGSAGHAHSHSKQKVSAQSAKDHANRALALLQQGDMSGAESILEAQCKRANANAEAGQVKLAVAAGLVRLAANLREEERQETRQGALDRASALTDEVIGSAAGPEKATALIAKARILQRTKGDEEAVRKLVEEARQIDPENPALKRGAKQKSSSARS